MVTKIFLPKTIPSTGDQIDRRQNYKRPSQLCSSLPPGKYRKLVLSLKQSSGKRSEVSIVTSVTSAARSPPLTRPRPPPPPVVLYPSTFLCTAGTATRTEPASSSELNNSMFSRSKVAGIGTDKDSPDSATHEITRRLESFDMSTMGNLQVTST